MTDAQIIKRITRIRAANNKAWMQLLQIALKSQPGRARKILSEITDNDEYISDLCRQLSKP